MQYIRHVAALALAALFLAAPAVHAQKGLIGKIDLATTKGVEHVKGEWRYHDVMTGVGPKENEIEPKAHGKFDDSTWDVLKPETLKQGRGAGGAVLDERGDTIPDERERDDRSVVHVRSDV